LFLIMIIMGASIFFMKPSQDELKKGAARMHADSVKKGLIHEPAITKITDTAAKTAAPKTVDPALLKSPFGAATIGTDKLVTLENKDVIIKLTTHGGRVYSVELKDYKTFNNKPLILFDGANNHFGIDFTAGNSSIHTDNLYFTPSADKLTVTGSDSSTVSMRLSYSPTQYIDYIYSLKGSGFKLGLTIKLTGLDQQISNTNTLNLNWGANMRKEEMDIEQERRYSTIYFIDNDGSIDYLSSNKDDQKTVTDKKLQWVSFQAHFFSGVIITDKGFDKANLSVTTDIADSTHSKEMTASLNVNKNVDGTFPLLFYFGPDKYSILKTQGYNLQKQIYMGWALFAWINRFAVLPVFNFFSQPDIASAGVHEIVQKGRSKPIGRLFAHVDTNAHRVCLFSLFPEFV